MQVFRQIESLQTALHLLPKTASVGFVPTMGALHAGHISLINKSKETATRTVVSIFVNPTQFDKAEDLENYPITIQSDLKKLQQAGCDYVFIPDVKEMYGDDVTSLSYDFKGLDRVMEGAHRSGHFEGVATIVLKLFEIVQPNYAFFGEKDFQQLQVIRYLVKENDLSLEIIGVPIFRENDGLAMSSRNTRLTALHRKEAPFIFKTLQKVQELFGTKNVKEITDWVYNQFERHPHLDLEYFMIAEEESLKPAKPEAPINDVENKFRAFIAVYAGKIRLIDNIALK